MAADARSATPPPSTLATNATDVFMKGIVVLLAVLVLFSAIAVPSEAWAWRGGHHGGCCWGGWWWPGAFVGGLALGAALSYPYPYYYAPPEAVYQPPSV